MKRRFLNKKMPPNSKQPRHETLDISAYIPPHLQQYVLPYQGDFCYSLVSSPQLIAHLMAEGFLPIAADGGILLPKLHEQRCVIRLPHGLHVSRSVRKKSKRYSITVNQDFDKVVEGCRAQHGKQCWLYPNILRAFRILYQMNLMNIHLPKAICPVRMYSVEVWNEQQELVAGELGYAVGSVYTSLTGYTTEDSAGSVQLCALGKLLSKEGFTTWDLGMAIPYKERLGAELMERDNFVALIHQNRETRRELPTMTPMSCRELIDESNKSDA